MLINEPAHFLHPRHEYPLWCKESLRGLHLWNPESWSRVNESEIPNRPHSWKPDIDRWTSSNLSFHHPLWKPQSPRVIEPDNMHKNHNILLAEAIQRSCIVVQRFCRWTIVVVVDNQVSCSRFVVWHLHFLYLGNVALFL